MVLLYRLAAASGRLEGEQGQDSQVRRSPFVPIMKFEDHGGIPIFIDQTAKISRIFNNWMIFKN